MLGKDSWAYPVPRGGRIARLVKLHKNNSVLSYFFVTVPEQVVHFLTLFHTLFHTLFRSFFLDITGFLTTMEQVEQVKVVLHCERKKY